MKFLEKDLEDIIFEANGDFLADRGLVINDNRIRQVSIGNYGISDIIAWDRCLESNSLDVDILELKRGVIKTEAMLQGLRYCQGVKSYMKSHSVYYQRLRIRLLLIGSSIDTKSPIIYLPNLIDGLDFSVSFIEYQYRPDGIYFDEKVGFDLKDKGFDAINSKGLFIEPTLN